MKETKIVQNVLTGYRGLMPHAPEIEAAVLGALLTESDTARKHIARIGPDYFYDPRYTLIFNACRELQKEGSGIDILTVTEQMRADGTLEAAGGPFRIAQLSGGMAGSAHMEYHIRILSQFRMRRSMLEITMAAQGKAGDETLDIDDTLTELQQQISQLAKGLPAIAEMRGMPEVIDSMLEELEVRMKNGGQALTGADTAFEGLNELLLGWNAGTLNVIGARTGEGKTAVLVYSLLHAARAGVPVCLISLESRAEKLAERWVLGLTHIPPDDWKRGRLTAEQLTQVKEACAVLKEVNLTVFDSGRLTMEQICVIVTSLHAEGKCGLLGLDYIQLCDEVKSSGPREQEVARNSRLLKLLSLKLNIPVIALTQLNREVMTNDKKMPHLENIRESGSIEQDADTVTFLFHPSKAQLAVAPESNYPVSPDMLMMIVAKNRNGKTGTAYVTHNESMTRFAEYAPPAAWVKRLAATKGAAPAASEWMEHDAHFQAYLKAQEEEKQNDGELPF